MAAPGTGTQGWRDESREKRMKAQAPGPYPEGCPLCDQGLSDLAPSVTGGQLKSPRAWTNRSPDSPLGPLLPQALSEAEAPPL